ncbi:MAG: penicillin-binding protein 1C [Myxococcota bacterium]
MPKPMLSPWDAGSKWSESMRSSGAGKISRLRPKRLFGAGLVLVAVALALGVSTRPPKQLFTRPPSKVLLSSDGQLLGARIAPDEQWRFPAMDQVPEKYRTAVLRFEDRRFDRHLGVDLLAVGRAILLNLRSGEVVSGASTITMQVVRLSRENRPRTYVEKLIEALTAFQLEARLSKNEILALYASHAPFGGNIVGLSAASWRYFGRGPQELSWAEASLLAVLPKNPAQLHPGRNREELKLRRDTLLRDLEGQGLIDALDLRLALQESLPEAPRPLPRLAPHLLDTLVARHPEIDRFETTLNRAFQSRLLERINRQADRLDASGVDNLAVLVLDNETLETVAYLGNARASFDRSRGRAVDMVQRRKSTGSVLKPFLYAAMLESGEILPEMLVPDVPANYAGFSPENFDRAYRGAVRADVALARSLNVPAVGLLGRHGVDRFKRTLTRLGMSTLHRPSSGYGLTLILGGAEGTLWELTGMYANLARLAKTAPHAAETLLRPSVIAEQVSPNINAAALTPSPIGAGSAWLTLRALAEVERPKAEGDWRAFSGKGDVSWKTGTSYGLRDAWAIGTNARYTVGVWAGNATGEGVPGLSGIETAGPVLFDAFDALPSAQPIPAPRHDLARVEVCQNDGYLANEHCAKKWQQVPRGRHFNKVTPHHPLVHLDRARAYQVDSRCASVLEMEATGWFTLPPTQEFYYRASHADYQSPPAYHPDCESQVAEQPMDLLYPGESTVVYIPVDLDGESSDVIFEAVHRDPDATLHWHLDDQYMASTRSFHQLALSPEAGRHRLTLVDQRGRAIDRVFRVLGEDRAGESPEITR